jgi:hypothetical protein
MNADWYIRNNQINKETCILTASEEIRNHKRRYQTRLENHSNLLAINLLDNSEERMCLFPVLVDDVTTETIQLVLNLHVLFAVNLTTLSWQILLYSTGEHKAAREPRMAREHH